MIQWWLITLQNRWHPDGNSACHVQSLGGRLTELLSAILRQGQEWRNCQDRMPRLDWRPDQEQRQRRRHEKRRPHQTPLLERPIGNRISRARRHAHCRNPGRAALPRPALGFHRRLRQEQWWWILRLSLPACRKGNLGL